MRRATVSVALLTAAHERPKQFEPLQKLLLLASRTDTPTVSKIKVLDLDGQEILSWEKCSRWIDWEYSREDWGFPPMSPE